MGRPSWNMNEVSNRSRPDLRSGPVRSGDPAFFDWSGPVRFGKQILPDRRISMLNLKYRKSGKYSYENQNFISQLQTRLYRIKCDRIKCDRIKYAFTGSYVSLQDQVWPDQVWPPTGSSVTGSNMSLQDHMCLYRIKCALHRIWSTALLFWFTTLPFVCIRLCSNFVCIMTTSRKNSEVWEHFTEEPGTSFALCKVCHGFDGHNNNCLKLRR